MQYRKVEETLRKSKSIGTIWTVSFATIYLIILSLDHYRSSSDLPSILRETSAGLLDLAADPSHLHSTNNSHLGSASEINNLAQYVNLDEVLGADQKAAGMGVTTEARERPVRQSPRISGASTATCADNDAFPLESTRRPYSLAENQAIWDAYQRQCSAGGGERGAHYLKEVAASMGRSLSAVSSHLRTLIQCNGETLLWSPSVSAAVAPTSTKCGDKTPLSSGAITSAHTAATAQAPDGTGNVRTASKAQKFTAEEDALIWSIYQQHNQQAVAIQEPLAANQVRFNAPHGTIRKLARDIGKLPQSITNHLRVLVRNPPPMAAPGPPPAKTSPSPQEATVHAVMPVPPEFPTSPPPDVPANDAHSGPGGSGSAPTVSAQDIPLPVQEAAPTSSREFTAEQSAEIWRALLHYQRAHPLSYKASKGQAQAFHTPQPFLMELSRKLQRSSVVLNRHIHELVRNHKTGAKKSFTAAEEDFLWAYYQDHPSADQYHTVVTQLADSLFAQETVVEQALLQLVTTRETARTESSTATSAKASASACAKDTTGTRELSQAESRREPVRPSVRVLSASRPSATTGGGTAGTQAWAQLTVSTGSSEGSSSHSSDPLTGPSSSRDNGHDDANDADPAAPAAGGGYRTRSATGGVRTSFSAEENAFLLQQYQHFGQDSINTSGPKDSNCRSSYKLNTEMNRFLVALSEQLHRPCGAIRAQLRSLLIVNPTLTMGPEHSVNGGTSAGAAHSQEIKSTVAAPPVQCQGPNAQHGRKRKIADTVDEGEPLRTVTAPPPPPPTPPLRYAPVLTTVSPAEPSVQAVTSVPAVPRIKARSKRILSPEPILTASAVGPSSSVRDANASSHTSSREARIGCRPHQKKHLFTAAHDSILYQAWLVHGDKNATSGRLFTERGVMAKLVRDVGFPHGTIHSRLRQLIKQNEYAAVRVPSGEFFKRIQQSSKLGAEGSSSRQARLETNATSSSAVPTARSEVAYSVSSEYANSVSVRSSGSETTAQVPPAAPPPSPASNTASLASLSHSINDTDRHGVDWDGAVSVLTADSSTSSDGSLLQSQAPCTYHRTAQSKLPSVPSSLTNETSDPAVTSAEGNGSSGSGNGNDSGGNGSGNGNDSGGSGGDGRVGDGADRAGEQVAEGSPAEASSSEQQGVSLASVSTSGGGDHSKDAVPFSPAEDAYLCAKLRGVVHRPGAAHSLGYSYHDDFQIQRDLQRSGRVIKERWQVLLARKFSQANVDRALAHVREAEMRRQQQRGQQSRARGTGDAAAGSVVAATSSSGTTSRKHTRSSGSQL